MSDFHAKCKSANKKHSVFSGQPTVCDTLVTFFKQYTSFLLF